MGRQSSLRRAVGAASLLLTFVCGVGRSALADIQYALTDLGPVGGQLSQFGQVLRGSLAGAQAIDNSGRIAGNYIPAGATNVHGFVWNNGVLTDIGFLSSAPSVATTLVERMDSAGNIYGQSSISSTDYHLFAYSNGTMKDIDPQLPNLQIWGNNQTTLVGETTGTVTNPVAHAITYQNGVLTDLGTLGGSNSEGFGINDAGQITGRSEPTTHDPLHAFLYSNGVMKDLGVISGNFHAMSEGLAVNSVGQVIGESAVAPSNLFHAFLYSNGHMTDLGVLGTKPGLQQSFAYGLNDAGDVVGGTQTDTSSSGVAFVYHNGVMADLNGLIDPGLGWQLSYATAINDLGQITGIGTAPSGAMDSYLLTPIAAPEPSSAGAFLAMFLWGLSGRRGRGDESTLRAR